MKAELKSQVNNYIDLDLDIDVGTDMHILCLKHFNTSEVILHCGKETQIWRDLIKKMETFKAYLDDIFIFDEQDTDIVPIIPPRQYSFKPISKT